MIRIQRTVYPDQMFSNYNDWINYIAFQNYLNTHRAKVRELTSVEFQKLKQ